MTPKTFSIRTKRACFTMFCQQKLCYEGENCHGGKLSKLPLIIRLMVNSDGSEKLQPLIIGKSGKPRCFKNVRSFPMKYKFNKKSWRTGKYIFYILFLDRCPAHPKTLGLTNIKLAFFPAFCTCELQPLALK